MSHILRKPGRYAAACMLAIVGTIACGRASGRSAVAHSTARAAAAHGDDSAFAALQHRGADPRGMGVDQYTSVHRFDALPDGGRIELRRAMNDSAGVAQIRAHLRSIASAFATGDFSTPAFVHLMQVPGTDVMAARRSHVTYAERDLPGGGEVRITTDDSAALAAIHRFMAYQRHEHHAGGRTDSGSPPAHTMHHD